ncbi:MAG: hypothetical protein ACQETE_01660 [Bacteroidota bacterium]
MEKEALKAALLVELQSKPTNVLMALVAITNELSRAERKFPNWPADPVHQTAIIAEEAGEAVKAALQFTYELETYDPITTEAIQTGAMAVRYLDNLPERMLEQRFYTNKTPGTFKIQNTAGPDFEF